MQVLCTFDYRGSFKKLLWTTATNAKPRIQPYFRNTTLTDSNVKYRLIHAFGKKLESTPEEQIPALLEVHITIDLEDTYCVSIHMYNMLHMNCFHLCLRASWLHTLSGCSLTKPMRCSTMLSSVVSISDLMNLQLASFRTCHHQHDIQRAIPIKPGQ